MPLYMLQIYDRILPTPQHGHPCIPVRDRCWSADGAGACWKPFVRCWRAGLLLSSKPQSGPMPLRVSMDNSRIGEVSIEPMRHLATIPSICVIPVGICTSGLSLCPDIYRHFVHLLHPVLFWLTLAGAVFVADPRRYQPESDAGRRLPGPRPNRDPR